MSQGGCSDEPKLALQRGEQVGSHMRTAGMLPTTGNSPSNEMELYRVRDILKPQ